MKRKYNCVVPSLSWKQPCRYASRRLPLSSYTQAYSRDRISGTPVSTLSFAALFLSPFSEYCSGVHNTYTHRHVGVIGDGHVLPTIIARHVLAPALVSYVACTVHLIRTYIDICGAISAATRRTCFVLFSRWTHRRTHSLVQSGFYTLCAKHKEQEISPIF